MSNAEEVIGGDEPVGVNHSGSPTRRRPSSRVTATENSQPAVITAEYQGVAAAYGNTLLFVGYEVDGLIEVVVYPRYRFSSDDRVQGHLGYVHAQPGTPWDVLLQRVDEVFEAAQSNYRVAVTLRSGEQRAHGASYDTAYETITDIFRESWHGFALRLGREGNIKKDSVLFTGGRRGPVLVKWRGEEYTLMVFPTGSITLVKGDRQTLFR
jgi:hypothetical protein